MNRRENYGNLVFAATGLALAILVTFQVYQWREPARLRADAAADLRESREEGEELYLEQCASCHGAEGEGGLGPALAAPEFLDSVADEQMFSLIRSGVPGTGMPAWAQSFGGPLTDQEIQHVVNFIRSWEGQELDVSQSQPQTDPERGAEIFAATCSFCHGVEGVGTAQGPQLNDPELLSQFDDEWFRETIVKGRPSKGMPTWGTVLSPEEIDHVVAYLRTWQEEGGESTMPSTGNGNEIDGSGLYISNCAACHGAAGEGGVGPALVGNDFVASQELSELVQFLAQGREGTAMPGFGERLSAAEISVLAELLLGW